MPCDCYNALRERAERREPVLRERAERRELVLRDRAERREPVLRDRANSKFFQADYISEDFKRER